MSGTARPTGFEFLVRHIIERVALGGRQRRLFLQWVVGALEFVFADLDPGLAPRQVMVGRLVPHSGIKRIAAALADRYRDLGVGIVDVTIEPRIGRAGETQAGLRSLSATTGR
jgi:hypothetical protein